MDKIILFAIIFAIGTTDPATIVAWINTPPILASCFALTFIVTALAQALGQISTGNTG